MTGRKLVLRENVQVGIIARRGGVEKIGIELLETSPLLIGKELGGILGRLLRYLSRRHGLDRFVGSRIACSRG
jgi:hypothetical protein